MRKVEWELNLNSADSIHQFGQDVVNELSNAKQKFDTFVNRVIETIARSAQNLFNEAQMDVRVKDGSSVQPQVSVDYDTNLKIVYACGANNNDFVFVEFGAGVYFNGYDSPHPPVAYTPISLEMGSYGKGHGIQTTWGFKDNSDKLVLTHGTPMQAPLYTACELVVENIYYIAKEVFG